MGKTDDAPIIGDSGRENDLAIGTGSSNNELEIVAQLRGNVDELETLIGKTEDATIIGDFGHEMISPVAPAAPTTNSKSLLNCAEMSMSWKLSSVKPKTPRKRASWQRPTGRSRAYGGTQRVLAEMATDFCVVPHASVVCVCKYVVWLFVGTVATTQSRSASLWAQAFLWRGVHTRGSCGNASAKWSTPTAQSHITLWPQVSLWTGFDMHGMPVGRLLVSTTHHTPQGVLVGTP